MWGYIKPFILFFLIVIFVAAFPAIALHSSCFLLCGKGQLVFELVDKFSMAVGMALALVLFSGFKLARIKHNFALHSTSVEHYPKYLLGLFGVYTVAVVSGLTSTWFFPGSGESYASDRGQYAYDGVENYYIYVVMSVMIIPVVEELLFRGYLQTKLMVVFRKAYIRYLIVSVFFTLMHFDYSVFTLVNVFTLSILLCWVREHSNSVYPAILLHMIFNTIGVVARTFMS